MNATLRRGAAVTLTALVLGTGLAACGGGSGNSSNPPATGPAPAGASAPASGVPASTGAGTAGSASAPAAGSSVDAATMTQKLKHAAELTQTAHVVLAVDAAGQSLKGEGDMQTKPLLEDLTMSMMGTNIEVRVVDGTFYVKLPMSAGLGKTWLKATPQQLGSASGMGSLSSMGDPLGVITKLGGALQSSTYEGSDATGQHYVLKVDMKKAMQLMGVPSAELSRLGGAVGGTVSENVWFDAAGHVVKVSLGLGTGGTMAVTMSDFGKHVDVQAPPAGQTRDFSGLGSQAHA